MRVQVVGGGAGKVLSPEIYMKWLEGLRCCPAVIGRLRDWTVDSLVTRQIVGPLESFAGSLGQLNLKSFSSFELHTHTRFTPHPTGSNL